MNRDSKVHAWLCWAAIALALTVVGKTYYESMAEIERMMARIAQANPEFQRTLDRIRTRERSGPPLWLIVVSCTATVLFLVACLSRRTRDRLRMRPRLSEPSVYGGIYLGAFALAILLKGLGLAGFQFRHWTPLLYLGMLGSLVAIAYAFVACRSVRTPLAEWGWSRGRGVALELSIGVLVAVTFKPAQHLLGSWQFDDSLIASSGFGFRFLRSVVWAPIVEETFFRGMLYRHLRDRWRWPVAVLISSAVFAAVHFPIDRWPNAFAIGLIYALLREWRGSLLAPIAAHASGNLLIHLFLE